MSEDVFRIVVTVAVSLAAIAFVVQTATMVALARAVRKNSGTSRGFSPGAV